MLETKGIGYSYDPNPDAVTAVFGGDSATARVLASRIVFIDDFGRETTTFPVGANVGVRLIEPASNNPGSFDTVYNMEIGVTYDAGLNSTGTTFRYLNLYETGLDTGVFEGRLPSSLADLPVAGVTWDEASAYASWVGKRLPTEAEWERVARGRSGKAFPYGETFDPKKIHEPTTLEYKEFDTGRRRPWAEDRVM